MQGHGNPKFIKEAVTTELYQLKQFIKKNTHMQKILTDLYMHESQV